MPGSPAVSNRKSSSRKNLPKMEIIARHNAVIDPGHESVIFGFASFAEGVDLVGEYCTHVNVSNLTSPCRTLRSKRHGARGWRRRASRRYGNQRPEAAVRLAQAVGRLIRTVTDYGDGDGTRPATRHQRLGAADSARPAAVRAGDFAGAGKSRCRDRGMRKGGDRPPAERHLNRRPQVRS